MTPELPSFHEAEFMYMGTVVSEQVDIHLYKHRDTRRYLNLDDDGDAYAYRGRLSNSGEKVGGCYQRYPSLQDALETVDLRIFDEHPSFIRSFPPDAWPAESASEA